MKLLDLKRMSGDWLEWRRHGIGGSDAPTVMDTAKASFKMSPKILWEEKTRRRLNRPSNFQMRRGLKLEPIARRAYEDLTGIEMEPVFGENETFTFIRASFDGLNFKAGRALEIKCPGMEDHAIAKAGKVPKHYLWQCVHLLLVSGLETVDYFSYHPDDKQKTALVEVTWNKELENQLIEREIEFWRCVLQDRPPTKPTKPGNIFPIRRSR